MIRMIPRFEGTLETGLRTKYEEVLNRSRDLTRKEPGLNRANPSFQGRVLTKQIP